MSKDDSDEEFIKVSYHHRYIIVTQSCLLILAPIQGHPWHAQLKFWATLQSLYKIRRNMSNPNLVALQWRTLDETKQKQLVTALKVGDTPKSMEDFLGRIVKSMN